jgi:hypothetical protein
MQADIRSKVVRDLIPVAKFLAGGKELPLFDVEQVKASRKN